MSGFDEVANNPETPVDDGQGEGTGAEELNAEIEQPETDQAQEVGDNDGKGIPDDPKLLRAKMTQETQRFNEERRSFQEYREKMDRLIEHPKFKEVYEEVTGTRKTQETNAVAAEKLKLEEMSDEQKAVYKTLKPFVNTILEELGITKKIDSIEKYTTTSSQKEIDREKEIMLTNFYTKHPEAKTETVNKAVADIVNERLNKGVFIDLEDAWKIYKADSAEREAKQKMMKENQLKKDADLPKPTGGSPTPIVNKKMSTRQAVEEALKAYG